MDNFDPLDQQGQEHAKNLLDERKKLAYRTEIDDVKWLMSDKRGRRIVWRILEEACVFKLSFDASPIVMSFNEGRRSEGLRLMATLHEHCSARYQEMVEEAQNDNRNADHG